MSFKTMRRIRPKVGKREARKRSCESKTRYESGRIVMQEAKRFRMQYYYCGYCGGWHLTSRL